MPPRQFERERERESKGCPIGNLTSQLFANIYLNELDQFIKHSLKEKYYIRYTDDFIVAHHDPNYLWTIKGMIEQFLASRLHMELHPSKVSLRKYTQGIDFLGYVVLPHAQVLRTKTKRRILRKIRERITDFKKENIPEETLIQSINSYFAVLSHAKSYKLKQHILHFIWSSLKSPDSS